MKTNYTISSSYDFPSKVKKDSLTAWSPFNCLVFLSTNILEQHNSFKNPVDPKACSKHTCLKVSAQSTWSLSSFGQLHLLFSSQY